MKAGVLASLALTALLFPGAVRATAGFAETHSRLEYSSVASIRWIHPGDGCDAGKYCFRVERADGTYAGFRGLDCSLLKINAPPEEGSNLILAQCSGDRGWLVYDLRTQEFLAEPGPWERAAAIWRVQGLAEPRFADAEHGARGLSRTWNSLVEDTLFLALLWLPALLFLLLPVFALVGMCLLVRYVRHRKLHQLVLGALFLVASLPGWWIVWRVVAARLAR